LDADTPANTDEPQGAQLRIWRAATTGLCALFAVAFFVVSLSRIPGHFRKAAQYDAIAAAQTDANAANVYRRDAAIQRNLVRTSVSDALRMGGTFGALTLACWIGTGIYLRRRFPVRGACRRCGYLLRGLTMPRCPECGQPFDPALLEQNGPD
jgi:hypothetical protein